MLETVKNSVLLEAKSHGSTALGVARQW